MEIKNPAALVLTAIAALGAAVAFVLFALINAGVFVDRDPISGGVYSAGPSAWIAVVPLALAVVAGIGAVVMWASASSRPKRAIADR